MTLLDRYYAKRIVGTMLRIVLSMTLLVIVVDVLLSKQDNIIKYKIPAWAVAEYYLCFIPQVLFEFHAAALSVLIAGLMVLGKSAQDNEVTAVLAGGISLRRIARAPVLVALIMAVGAFVFQDTLGVTASRTFNAVEKKYFRKIGGPARQGTSWTNLGGVWTCHVLKFNPRAMTGEDVYLHAIRPNRVDEIRAKRIYWDETERRWYLEDGRWAAFDPGKDWEVVSQRITRTPAPFTESPEALFALDEPSRSKSVRELTADLRRAERLGTPALRQRVEYHLKFAQPALCFVMIFLAIPFALRLRRGGFMLGVGASIGIGLAYLTVFYVSVGLGYMGTLPPPVAAWLANILFLAGGLELFRRTPT
jgi:lipopolysaccharide export system permease protein